MKERPILFSGPMVRAILEGRKTQTRRPIRGVPPGITDVRNWGSLDPMASDPSLWGFWGCEGFDAAQPHNCLDFEARCPFGAPGDRLWVRETWSEEDVHEISYRATDKNPGLLNWRPSIHMPRWASRITLEVTGVGVERLQDISQEDAQEEGIRGPLIDPELDRMVGGQIGVMPREAFARGWDHINGKRAPWDSNPWVWVVSFRRTR